MSGIKTTRAWWRQALSQRGVWQRSLVIGLPVGVVQILVNQGDHWWRLDVDAVIVLKTLMTPLIATSVALLSAAGSFVQVNRDRSVNENPQGMMQ
ncbi:MAG: hypothetical protein AABP62_02730 [Planctomycetota bacterium]